MTFPDMNTSFKLQVGQQRERKRDLSEINLEGQGRGRLPSVLICNSRRWREKKFYLLLLSIVEADEKVDKDLPLPQNFNNVKVWFYKL